MIEDERRPDKSRCAAGCAECVHNSSVSQGLSCTGKARRRFIPPSKAVAQVEAQKGIGCSLGLG